MTDSTFRTLFLVASLSLLGACGDDGSGADAGFVCDFALDFPTGDANGHASPLGSAPGEARAGRITADDLPLMASGLQVYAGGDFVLANDKFALLIEDVGDSDLYDPWGGRPVGISSVSGGALLQASNFGEFFIFTGADTVITETVTVLNDGSDGEAAVIRAEGRMGALPFVNPVINGLFPENYGDMRAAIDYVLEPGADYVDIKITYHSPRRFDERVATGFHGFMYTKRMRRFTQGDGFDAQGNLRELGFIDEAGPSYSYSSPGEILGTGVSVSGFAAHFSPEFTIAGCGATERTHARLTIGGAGVNGIVQTLASVAGETLREVTGTVTNSDGSPAVGVRVHALATNGDYLTRAMSASDGSYSLHVPTGEAVNLTSYRVGNVNVEVSVAAGAATADLQLAAVGTISVTTIDQDTSTALPVRIQVLPTTQGIASVPDNFGEEPRNSGRLHVEYAMDGTASMRAPVGDWEVIVSRGYEYELFSEVVTVTDGGTVNVAASLEHVVDTTGQLCADFHIHTIRSADSGDDVLNKVRSAVADGLELPVRSEHEYAADFKDEITELGVESWAYGMPSVELTTMEFAGHFGVVPSIPDLTKPNANAPKWQRFSTQDNPDQDLVTMEPPEVLANVRARPEAPAVIVNHPRGGQNYFEYVGFDPVTAMFDDPEKWDEEISLIEIFNDSSWKENLGGTVADWLALLGTGRQIYAVGSSDSHGLSRSPVGYPRTCLDLGTDDTTSIDNNDLRDATASGKSSISGGIYVTATVNGVGHGGVASGLGATTNLNIKVQAASWVDVDSIDVVVDGIISTIDILPGDANMVNPAIRFEKDVVISVSQDPSAYVIVAVYGSDALEPVHPGRIAFGVSNPIFLSQ